MQVKGRGIGLQLPLGLGLRPGFRYANFVPGANAEVLAGLRGGLGSGLGNDLAGHTSIYLWGAPATGKTHLLQAACQEQAERGGRCAYLPLRHRRELAVEMLGGLERAHLVCLDDVDALAGVREWQQAVFALYDGLREHGGRLLAAGPVPPAALPLELEDLRTRLAWGLVYQLQPLDDEDKLRGLQQRARERGLELPDAVARYLLQRCRRDMASLLHCLDVLDRASLAAQRRLTIPFVKEVMAWK